MGPSVRPGSRLLLRATGKWEVVRDEENIMKHTVQRRDLVMGTEGAVPAGSLQSGLMLS